MANMYMWKSQSSQFSSVKMEKSYMPYLVEFFKVVLNRNATLYRSHRFMKFLPGVLSIIIW